MDIRTKAVELTGVLHLKDANDEPMFDEPTDPEERAAAGLPVVTITEEWMAAHKLTVTLYSPGSKVYARAQQKQTNRQVDLLKKKGKTETTADKTTKDTAEFLTECTKAFSPNFDYGELKGGNPDTKDMFCMAIYQDIEIGFIAEQVSRHLREWGNFSKASTNSSASSSATQPG